MMILKQSTAVDVLIGPFVDLTDASTAEPGESPSVKLSKNGQTLAAKSDVTTPVHDADGYYNCELDATDTNTVGTLILTVAASASALPVRHEFQVMEEATYDALYGAAAPGYLQPTTAGRTLDVTATGASGIDWGNIENPTTVVDLSGTDINLVDTTTTNTDMRGTDSALLAASAPTNFGDMAITVTTGQVTIGTNNDKSGYSISGTKTTLDALNDITTAQVNTEVDTALSDIKLDHLVAVADADDPVDGSIIAELASATGDWSTFVASTDSMQALRDRGDAAWTTGAGGTPPDLLQNTTITGLSTQLVFNLTAGSSDDDAYDNATAVITDAVTAEQKSCSAVGSYVGATKTITLSDTPIFTIANGDTIDLIVAPKALALASALQNVDGNVDALTTTIGVAGAGLTDLGGMSTGMKAEVNAEADTAISDAALATAANLATVDTVVDGLATTLGTAGAGLTDLGGMSTTMKAEVNAEADTAISDAALATAASIAALNDFDPTAALTESYAADGATFSMAQALYMLHSSLSEFSISGTTLTAKQLDGSTTAMTFTLDDASNPTSRTRAT